MREPGCVVSIHSNLIDIKNLQRQVCEHQPKGKLKLRYPGLLEPIIILEDVPGIASKTRGLQRKDEFHFRLVGLDAHQVPVRPVVHRSLFSTEINHDCAGLAPADADQHKRIGQGRDEAENVGCLTLEHASSARHKHLEMSLYCGI